jgi:hypothetical protein
MVRHVHVRQNPVMSTLLPPLRLSGIRIDCMSLTTNTNIELVRHYPQPTDRFLTMRTGETGIREGPFAILGFRRKHTQGVTADGPQTIDSSLDFAVILGFFNIFSPCCQLVKNLEDGSQLTEKDLQRRFYQCTRNSLSILAPNDTIHFFNGEPGAISMWKEEVDQKVIAVVKLHSQSSMGRYG